MKLSMDGILGDATTRERWIAFYRLHRLSARQEFRCSIHDALCVLAGQRFGPFFSWIAQKDDPLQYSWAEFPLMRKLMRPKRGPMMERIYNEDVT